MGDLTVNTVEVDFVMKTVRQTDYMNVIWDDENRIQITEWPGGYVGDRIREGLDLALEAFIELRKAHPDAAWLGDTRELGVINATNQEWIDKDWFPRFLATGVQLMAVLAPKSTISKMAVEAIVARVPGTSLTSRYFVSPEEATEWVISERKAAQET